ncbi:MAG TPA: thiamine phosphate synthase [Terriglobales bacterium]|nr:thiamine phosphate synthase [Terriglobales bacterium]
MLLCYITDRTSFPGDESARQHALLAKIAEASCAGVDLIQLREKDLSTRNLEVLACAAIQAVRENYCNRATRLLINSRSDVAIACGADGVHLRSDDISPSDVRKIWISAGNSPRPLVSVSCHTVAEVASAASASADFAIFAPVFEKKYSPAMKAAGLDQLRSACSQKIPVLALGGVTLENAAACIEDGAAGIAAIRLFQESDIAAVVRQLRR